MDVFVHKPYSMEGWIAPPTGTGMVVDFSEKPCHGHELCYPHIGGLTMDTTLGLAECSFYAGTNPLQTIMLGSPPLHPSDAPSLLVSPSSSFGSLDCHLHHEQQQPPFAAKERYGADQNFGLPNYSLDSARCQQAGRHQSTTFPSSSIPTKVMVPSPRLPSPGRRAVNFGEALHGMQKFVLALGGNVQAKLTSSPFSSVNFDSTTVGELVREFGPIPSLGPSATPELIAETIFRDAPCSHMMSWKRLRAKRGLNHLLCYYCGAKWKTHRAPELCLTAKLHK